MYDRAITSAPLRSLIGKLFTDGIAPNPSDNLQVTTGDGMTVTVKAGFAICGSCLKLEEVARTLAVQASDANYDRIDSVVLRLNTNDNARYCDLYVVQGTPATTPVRPALTRTSTIWEIGLADIFVVKNSGAISAARITDTRYDATRCGVISSISEFDTTTIYNQVQADLAEFKAEEQSDFLVWYEQMRNQLSEDAAGSLQQQIDAMKDSILDTMEEVNANTQDNQLAGAKAVKELGEDLSGMNKNFYKVDLNTITYKTSGYCNECFNVPEGAGSGYIEVIPVGDGGSSLVLQRYTMYNSRIVWIRQKVVGGSWTKWIDPLAYYLPLTGGTITGALIVNSYIKQGKYLVPSCSATTFIMGVYEFEQEFGTGSTPTSYGMIIIHGNSRPGSWVDDTYYHIIDSDGNSYNGRQTGGATAITWDRHLTVNDFVITGTEDDATLTINLD